MQALIEGATDGWIVAPAMRFLLRGAFYPGRVAPGHPEATISTSSDSMEGVDVVVLHWSAGWGEPADVFRYIARTPDAESYHFVLGRSGSIWQAVSLLNSAFHAGDGRLPEHADLDVLVAVRAARAVNFDPVPRRLNNRSIGICLCNRGPLTDGLRVKARMRGYGVRDDLRHRNPGVRTRTWESYPALQIEALDRLVAHLARVVPSLRFVLGHEDVTHRRTLGHLGAKLDPGPAFPWGPCAKRRDGLVRVAYDFDRAGWMVPGV